MKRLCNDDVNNYMNSHKCSYAKAYTILEKKTVNLPLNLHEQEIDDFDYEESQHPRDEGGQWTEGGGGGNDEGNGGDKENKESKGSKALSEWDEAQAVEDKLNKEWKKTGHKLPAGKERSEMLKKIGEARQNRERLGNEPLDKVGEENPMPKARPQGKNITELKKTLKGMKTKDVSIMAEEHRKISSALDREAADRKYDRVKIGGKRAPGKDLVINGRKISTIPTKELENLAADADEKYKVIADENLKREFPDFKEGKVTRKRLDEPHLIGE